MQIFLYIFSFQVLGVVKEQITRALQVQPRSFEVLKTRLQTLTYQDILKLWAEDRQKKEDWESQAKPIMLVLKLLLYSGLFFVGVNYWIFIKKGIQNFLAVIIWYIQNFINTFAYTLLIWRNLFWRFCFILKNKGKFTSHKNNLLYGILSLSGRVL